MASPLSRIGKAAAIAAIKMDQIQLDKLMESLEARRQARAKAEAEKAGQIEEEENTSIQPEFLMDHLRRVKKDFRRELHRKNEAEAKICCLQKELEKKTPPPPELSRLLGVVKDPSISHHLTRIIGHFDIDKVVCVNSRIIAEPSCELMTKVGILAIFIAF